MTLTSASLDWSSTVASFTLVAEGSPGSSDTLVWMRFVPCKAGIAVPGTTAPLKENVAGVPGEGAFGNGSGNLGLCDERCTV